MHQQDQAPQANTRPMHSLLRVIMANANKGVSPDEPKDEPQDEPQDGPQDESRNQRRRRRRAAGREPQDEPPELLLFLRLL